MTKASNEVAVPRDMIEHAKFEALLLAVEKNGDGVSVNDLYALFKKSEKEVANAGVALYNQRPYPDKTLQDFMRRACKLAFEELAAQKMLIPKKDTYRIAEPFWEEIKAWARIQKSLGYPLPCEQQKFRT